MTATPIVARGPPHYFHGRRCRMSRNNLERFLARWTEKHIGPKEEPTSPEAKVAVAAFIGEIRLAWKRGEK